MVLQALGMMFFLGKYDCGVSAAATPFSRPWRDSSVGFQVTRQFLPGLLSDAPCGALVHDEAMQLPLISGEFFRNLFSAVQSE